MDNLTMYLLSATVYTGKSEILNDLKHFFLGNNHTKRNKAKKIGPWESGHECG